MKFIKEKLNEGNSDFINLIIEIVKVSIVVFYILHSVIKRFAENQKLQFIPFVLLVTNCLILFEILILVKQKKIDCTSKNVRSIIFQIILSFSFSIFIYYFYLKQNRLIFARGCLKRAASLIISSSVESCSNVVKPPAGPKAVRQCSSFFSMACVPSVENAKELYFPLAQSPLRLGGSEDYARKEG